MLFLLLCTSARSVCSGISWMALDKKQCEQTGGSTRDADPFGS